MRKIRAILNGKLVDSSGLGIFRILFSFYLLLEILNLINHYHLIFDPVPYLNPASSVYHALIYVWFVVVVFLMIGLYTTYISILNYLLSLLFFTSQLSASYQAHFICISINLLLIFIPSNASFSVDKILASSTKNKIPNQVSALSYYALTLFGIGFVYFESMIWKLFSTLWAHGLSIWAGASYLPIACYDLSAWLNNEFVLKVFCYIALIFEAAFLIIFSFKRFRTATAVIGIVMHLAIAVLFPIRLFGIQFAIFYIVVLPMAFGSGFRNVFNWFIIKISSFVRILPIPYVQGSYPSFKTLKLVFGLMVVYQLLFIAVANPVSHSLAKKIPSKYSGVKEVVNAFNQINITSKLTGIVGHPLFLDNHFVPRSVYKIVYESPDGTKERLPMVEETGLCNPNIEGVVWKCWALGTLNKKDVEPTFARFTADYIGENKLSFEEAKFAVYEKKINMPKRFEPDVLKGQIELPWTKMATFAWKENKWTCTYVSSIESDLSYE